MVRTTPTPNDEEIYTAMREAFQLTERDMDASGVCITRKGTRIVVRWFGGLMRDFCEVDGDLAFMSPSHYWANRRKFANALGVVIEDAYHGYDLFMREDY